MREDIKKELLDCLAKDFRFEGRGDWLQKGKCPSCGQKELFTRADAPWVLRCGRTNKCGYEEHVKDRYPDIFDNWSNRYKATEANPNAAADAYLSHARGLNLDGLRGCYAQEHYADREAGISTATVRFPLPGGSWWERLIDQPGRFTKKARFAFGKSYAGQWWTAPDDDLEKLARAERIWIAEGIFDALSFRQAGEVAASAMSTNNYPEIALAELKKKIAELGLGHGPQLIFAFDVGKAGRDYSIKYVDRARKDGWRATAATPLAEGEGDKVDWNDLLMRDRLGPEHLEEYLWHGEVMIAPNATEKACLIYDRKKLSSFSFVHDSRTWWASFNKARIAEVMAKEGLSEKGAARVCADVDEIASCAFRILYFQRDIGTDDSRYYLRVDTPSSNVPEKAAFSSSALAAGPEFKKRLLDVDPGAQWFGTTRQLERLVEMQKGKRGIRRVQALDFTGYSREHEAWIFGDIAVKAGRVHRINEEDYFDLGKMALKLGTRERLLAIDYDPDQFDASWLPVVWQAFRTNGLITVAFWVMSFFAEQIRKHSESLGFLEMIGEPGTGKSTLVTFLWKTCGRFDHEGFNPRNSTNAAIARHVSKVGNLPVVFMEGDKDPDKPSHARGFEWEELKPAFNGRSIRSRGVKSGGNETYDPPFRGAVVIEQNFAVDASPAVLDRIMQLTFDKVGWNSETKIAATKLENWPTDALSGFMVHIVRREEQYLKVFREAYARHDAEFDRAGRVSNVRIVRNHSQLCAALEALAAVAGLPQDVVEKTLSRIHAMAGERLVALSADHEVVQRFWETFDHLEMREDNPDDDVRINRHRKPEQFIAVSLPHFEERCRARGLTPERQEILKRHLKTSKTRKFLYADTVNTISGKHQHCWVFERPKSAASRSSSRQQDGRNDHVEA